MNLFSQVEGILRWEYSRISQKKKMVISLFFVCLPALILGTLRHFGNSVSPEYELETYLTVSMKFFLQLILPLLCLIYGTSMIKDEWEEGSLVFLFSTSTSRVILFLGKFWINLVFLLCFLWSGFLLANLAFFLFYGWNWHDQMPLLFYFGKAILLGVVFYLSFFVCLGFFLSKPFIGGVLCIILEYTLLLFPKFAIQKITPIYYLQNIIEIQEISFLKGFSELALNFQKNWNPLASSSAFLYLGMAFLIFLLIGIFQFQRLEAGSHKNSI